MAIEGNPSPPRERVRRRSAELRAALLREKQREDTKIAIARQSTRRIERELATLDREERRAQR